MTDDSSMTDLAAAAAKLNFVRAGTGEPLVLIHSLGGSIVMWEPVLELLAADFDVIAVDLPGFGDSPKLPDDLAPTPRNLALSVAELASQQGIDRPFHVSGISLGGWVAIECGRIGRAASVTGLCSAGFWPEALGTRVNTARGIARLLLPLVPIFTRSPERRRKLLASNMVHGDRTTPEQATAIIRGYAKSPGFVRTNNLMRNAVVGPLDDLGVPTTLAWAEHDNLVRRRPLAGAPGHVEQAMLPGCGHVPTWDDPELVSRVIGQTAARAATATAA